MSQQHCQFSTTILRTADEVFQWHRTPGALERLTPPWETIEVSDSTGDIQDGDRVNLRQKMGLLSFRWEVEHRAFIENREFTDVALHGPFTQWEHRHCMVPDGPGTSNLVDSITYKLPFGIAGDLIAGKWTKRKLERLFAFRHRRFTEDINATSRYGTVRPLKFLLSGASGFLGSALIPFLRSQGHTVVKLVRRPSRGVDEVTWDPQREELDPGQLREVDVVINLAGASVARRWSQRVRDEIWHSRLGSTRTLVKAMAQLRHPPFVFINASAVGIYGSQGDQALDEDSETGQGFLAEVCEAWEKETERLAELEIRAATLRTGIVLSPKGGAMASLLPIFKAGLGGPLGAGQQWMSWISIDDWIGAMYHAVLDRRCIGAVNVTSPHPVRNAEFSRVLADVLRRPCLFKVPAPLIRLAFGEMADEALLSSAKVYPRRLLETGYLFRHTELKDVLSFLLGRTGSKSA